MNYDNEAIVRNAYNTAEGNVLDIPGWIGSFIEDGVFNNVTGEESYRGEHLKDVVFFYMRNGKIERFDCYPALNIMLKQMGVPPDFASAVKRSTQR